MKERWKNHIQQWRDAAGLTQEGLGGRCKPPIGKGMISQYESGKRRPRQATLENLAGALGATAGQLLSGPPGIAVPAVVVNIWTRIPPDRKPQAIEVLKTFLEEDN